MQRIRMRMLADRVENLPMSIKAQMDCDLLWDLNSIAKYLERLSILGCEICETPSEDNPVEFNGRYFDSYIDLLHYKDGINDAIKLLEEF